MGYILALLLLILSFWVFLQRGERKILPFFIFAICLSGVSVSAYPQTIINIHVFFFLSLLLCWKSFYRSFNKTILWWLMLLMLIATTLLWLHSPNFQGPSGALRLFKTELIEKYLVICYAFFIFKNRNCLHKILTVSFYCLIVLTFFGLINLLLGHSIFVDWALEGAELNEVTQDAGGKYELAERFRVMAMHPNPFSYGYICVVMLLLFLYGKDRGSVNKLEFYTSLFCCLFGIVACGCRTIVVIAFGGFMVYYTLTRGVRKSVLFYVAGVLLIVLILSVSPSAAEKFNFFLTIFDDRSNVSGSSDLNMRSRQLAAVLLYIQNDPLYGLGKDYFYLDMDWASGNSRDAELHGMEGVYLNLLLERGFIGLFFYVLFWIVLTIKFFISRKKDYQAVAFALSVIAAYLVFAIMTGELNSTFTTLLLCGLALADIDRNETIVPKRKRKKVAVPQISKVTKDETISNSNTSI